MEWTGDGGGGGFQGWVNVGGGWGRGGGMRGVAEEMFDTMYFSSIPASSDSVDWTDKAVYLHKKKKSKQTVKKNFVRHMAQA
jgi:hypothetical protein